MAVPRRSRPLLLGRPSIHDPRPSNPLVPEAPSTTNWFQTHFNPSLTTATDLSPHDPSSLPCAFPGLRPCAVPGTSVSFLTRPPCPCVPRWVRPRVPGASPHSFSGNPFALGDSQVSVPPTLDSVPPSLPVRPPTSGEGCLLPSRSWATRSRRLGSTVVGLGSGDVRPSTPLHSPPPPFDECPVLFRGCKYKYGDHRGV